MTPLPCPRRLLPCLLLALAACSRAHAQERPAAPRPAARPAQPAQPAPASPARASTPQEPDGNDDPVADTGSGPLPTEAHFERVGHAPLSLRRVCDLRVYRDALYAAHANAPLGSDGATITRYQPDARPAFTVAFDWNRPGEPTRGGGAGQGFVRVRHIGERLFVPDADPPYAGFGYAFPGTEGYVYVSDAAGAFAPARGEHHHPPARPAGSDGAGAGVLPRAYHVLDVIRFRGGYYASGGGVPPGQRPWYGASPGALFLANPTLARWTYGVDYPNPWGNGVWRMTFLVRFRDRLYAGLQDYDGREPNDYAVVSPAAGATTLAQTDVRGVRVTARGAALTLRWYADAGKLYWIALERDGNVALRVTDDGEHWRAIALPPMGGRPTDITRFRGSLVVLTERRLYRLDGETPVPIARVEDERSPFELGDAFCAAPLAVYRNALYAGGQRAGALYVLADGPAPMSEPAPRNAPRRRGVH